MISARGRISAGRGDLVRPQPRQQQRHGARDGLVARRPPAQRARRHVKETRPGPLRQTEALQFSAQIVGGQMVGPWL